MKNVICSNEFRCFLTVVVLGFIPALLPGASMGQNDLVHPVHRLFEMNEPPLIKWQYTTGAAIYGSPLVSGHLVYFGNLDSLLFAIDLETGQEKWRFHTMGEIRSTVCISGDTLYLNGGDGQLYALDKQTGDLHWTFPFGIEQKYDFADYFHSSPVIRDNMIFVGSGDGRIYAIERHTGTAIWSFQSENPVHGTPAIGGEQIYFGSFDGKVYCLDIADGELNWVFKTVGHRYFPRGEVQGSPVVSDGLVFVGARDYNVYALDAQQGFCHWNKAFTKGWGLSLSIRDSVLFIGSADERVLIATDPRTGTNFWQRDMEFLVFGANAYDTEHLYVGTTNGKLHCFNKRTGEKAWSFETETYLQNRSRYFKEDDSYRDDIYSIILSNEQFLEVEVELGGIFSTPVLLDDVLVLTSTNGTLYCLKNLPQG